MDIVAVEKDGIKYEDEYFSDDEMVTVYGKNAQLLFKSDART
jgi:hypothetical protein